MKKTDINKKCEKYSVTQAQKFLEGHGLKYTTEHIRRLCRTGAIKSEKVFSIRVIPKTALVSQLFKKVKAIKP